MLLTYGHGTESSERTVATLSGAAVSSLVDIRTAPGSRRNPQFARAALAEAVLAEAVLAEAVLAEAVLAEAESRRVAVMCSESLWRRCHGRLVADFVSVARRVEVRHLMHDGRIEEHRPSAGLRLRDDGLLVYDAGQASLL